MKWSNKYDIYTNEIRTAVKRYIYDNYMYDPIIGSKNLDSEWYGQIFDTSIINESFHLGLVEGLRDNGMMAEIISLGYSKFVVTPDVFSHDPLPKEFPKYNQEFDLDRRQIIYMNNSLFELADNHLKTIKYNYNSKTYIFFNPNDTLSGIFTGPGNLELIDIGEGLIDDDTRDIAHWETDYRLVLNFTDSRKIYIGNDIEISSEEYIPVSLWHPNIVVDYKNDLNGDQNIEDTRLRVHGLTSLNPNDIYISEPIEDHDIPDHTFIHNRHINFATTAIIIYEDNTFDIVNFKNPPKDSTILRIDKHTVQIKKNDSISKVLLFVNTCYPVGDHYRTDEVYDAVMLNNNKGFLLMEKHHEYTNIMINIIRSNPNITVPELIDMGYKYDADILTIIQRSIPTYIGIPKSNVLIKNSINGVNFYRPKIVITVPNRIQLFPQLIINNRLVTSQYKIHKDSLNDYIVLDFRMFGIKFDEITEEVLLDIVQNKIKSIEVMFIGDSFYDESGTDSRPKRILSHSSVHKRITSLDTFTGYDDSVLFVNGRLTYSSYVDDDNYSLNYGLNSLPIYDGSSENIERYYNPVKLSPYLSDLGFEIGNPTINILDKEKSSNMFLVDITVDDKMFEDRNTMILNLSRGSSYSYDIIDNKPSVDDSMVPLTKLHKPLDINRTVLFDYDGKVIKPSMLSKDYLDFSNTVVYRHTSRHPNISSSSGRFVQRTNDHYCVHRIDLAPANNKYGLDLTIDENLLDEGNVGRFNDRVMSDPTIRHMFIFPSRVSEVSVVSTLMNNVKALQDLKCLSSYWFAHNTNTTLDKTEGYETFRNIRGDLLNSSGMPMIPRLDELFPEGDYKDERSSLYLEQLLRDILVDSDTPLNEHDGYTLNDVSLNAGDSVVIKHDIVYLPEPPVTIRPPEDNRVPGPPPVMGLIQLPYMTYIATNKKLGGV